MLIFPSLLFAISFSFLTQVAVFAAPLPLNDLSINARSDHESAGQRNSRSQPQKMDELEGMF